MPLAEPAGWLLYLRKSVGYAGITRQRASTTGYLQRRGGHVIDEFSDADASAFRSRDIDAPLPPRPDFDRMLEAMAGRPGAGLAAWHVDRLGRDPEATEILIRACRKGGHLIRTERSGDYDVTTANGRKHLRDDINAAAHEVDHGTERLIEAKAEHAREGRWLGGLRPFGWEPDPAAIDDDGKRIPGILRLRPSEAAALEQACRDVLAGTPVRAIARRWNALGLTGTAGGRWTTSTVHKVLIRPRNCGLAEWHGELITVEGGPSWPAITDEATWRGVRAMLTSPARRSNRGGTAATHLMTGHALCGGCGITVVAGNDAGGTARYRCARHVRELPPRPGPHASRRVADVDAYIAYLAVGRMRQAGAAGLLRPDHAADRAALIKEEAGLTARRAEQWQLYQGKVITAWEMADGRRGIDAELSEVRARLGALDEADVLAPMLADPEAAWDRAPLDQKRAVVAALMYVTLMPGAKYSRPPGWRPGDGQFDPRLVDVRWRRRLPGDG